MPKVSVIIPNYNHARFLEKRIQSVLNQTYEDFEIIYLDDASTDNSNQVIEKFLDGKRIRTIFNQTNSGSTFKQWNKGIDKAKGEYIWLAESDDYADENLLSELVTRLDTYPTVGIAYCQSWIVDENDNILISWEEWTKNAFVDEQRWKQDFVNNGKDECVKSLVIDNSIFNASAVLIRRSVYESVGGADESMKLCGDWMLWVKILLTSDFAFVAKPLNYFRKHTNTVRSSTKANLLLEEYCRMIHYISKNIQVPEDILEEACNGLTIRWLYRICYYNDIGFISNQRIYRILSDIEPRINSHLLKEILKKPTLLRSLVKNIFKAAQHKLLPL